MTKHKIMRRRDIPDDVFFQEMNSVQRQMVWNNEDRIRDYESRVIKVVMFGTISCAFLGVAIGVLIYVGVI